MHGYLTKKSEPPCLATNAIAAELDAKVTAGIAALKDADQKIIDAEKTVKVTREERKALFLALGKNLLKVKTAYLEYSTGGNSAFVEYYKKHGLSKQRVSDLLCVAEGKSTYEELTEGARERQTKSRDNKKKEKAVPKSVTPPVTDPKTGEAKNPSPAPKPQTGTASIIPGDSAAQMGERFAAMDAADKTGAPEEKPVVPEDTKSKADKVSAKNLSESEYAARLYLPKLNAADLEKARALVAGWQASGTVH
jgi:hypothetical protein